MELCGSWNYTFRGHQACGRIISDFGQFNHGDHSPELGDSGMVQLSTGMPAETAVQNYGESHSSYSGSGGTYQNSYADPDGTFSTIRDLCGFELNVQVPAGAKGFAVDFIFFSAEYPEWLGQGYNDTFNIILNSQNYSGNVAFDSTGSPISINNVLFNVCSGCDTPSTTLSGTGYDGGVGGATGWLTTTVPVVPGEVLSLYFAIYDEGDSLWDSDVLINNFRWLEFQPGTGPVTE